MVIELDQYADGKAARLWGLYIGDQKERTGHYKQFLQRVLEEHGCRSVLDVACGTGIDSVMLLDDGYEVTSCDFSDKMLKSAWQTRWQRRKEPAFDRWEIYEANWLTLPRDLESAARQQYDAVICLGNSFAHLPDPRGNQETHRLALRNFTRLVRPGGLLLIDHRNYDFIIDHGRAPTRNIYYNSKHVSDIRTSVIYQNGEPRQIVLDYFMGHPNSPEENGGKMITNSSGDNLSRLISESSTDNEFTLTYYPHRFKRFVDLLRESFQNRVEITSYGDFQPISSVSDPAFYIHVCRKQLEPENSSADEMLSGSTCSWSSGEESI